MHRHGVTFSFGSAKVCSATIFDTCFSYDKDIWINYCMYFYIIVLIPLIAILQLTNFAVL